MEFKAKFITKGFEVGKDVSSEEFNKLTNQLVMMHNLFTENFNTQIDTLNDIWHRYEFIRDNCPISVELMRMVMEIDEKCTYKDWLKKWMLQDADAIDKGFFWTRLKGYIKDDEDLPMYGVEFKDHPDWKIYIGVEAV